jgi:hypothetical protein
MTYAQTPQTSAPQVVYAQAPSVAPPLPPRGDEEVVQSRIGHYIHHIPFLHNDKSDADETASLYSSDSFDEESSGASSYDSSSGSDLDIGSYITEINTCYGARAARVAHQCVADLKTSRPDEKHLFTCANADVANALLTQN